MNHLMTAFLIGMLYAVICFRRVHLQKQPPEVFLKKFVLGNSVKFTEKTHVLDTPFFLFLLEKYAWDRSID